MHEVYTSCLTVYGIMVIIPAGEIESKSESTMLRKVFGSLAPSSVTR